MGSQWSTGTETLLAKMRFTAIFLFAAAVLGVCAGSPASLSRFDLDNPNIDWCEGCKNVISTMKQIVIDAGQEKVESFLNRVCDLTPLPLNYACKFFVGQYGEQIFEVIETLEEVASCQKLHLCSAPSYYDLFTPRVNEKCGSCTSAIDQLKKTAETKGKEETKKKLAGLCKVAAGFEEECKAIVENYFDLVFDFIMNHTSFEICQKAGMC